VDNSTVQVVQRFKFANCDPSDSDEPAQESAESSSDRSSPHSQGSQFLTEEIRESEVEHAAPVFFEEAIVESAPSEVRETFYNYRKAKRQGESYEE
jgi:hypothetical protein